MNRFIFMLTMLLAIAACSRDDGATGDGGIRAVEMQAGYVRATPSTRSVTAFTEPFDLFLTQTASTPGGYTLMDGKFDVTQNAGAFTLVDASSNTIYWDDIGGRDARLTFVAVYPKGSTGSVEPTDPASPHSFEFEVEANQTGTNFTASDLLVSKWVSDYSVSQQNSVSPAVVEFSHVLSKITFVVSKGTGFGAGEDFEPALEVCPFLRKGDVTILPALTGGVTVSPQSGGAVKMTPYKNADGLTFELVVIPGQDIVEDQLLAEATVTTGTGATNMYNIYAKTTDITLEAGKDYRFNVTLNKTDGEVTSAVVMNWDDGGEVTDDDVRIKVGVGTGSNAVGLVTGASFLMSVDEQNTVYTYNGSKWVNPMPQLYWDDIRRSATLVAEAVLYNNTNLTAIDPKDIYVGQTVAGDLEAAVDFIHFSSITHPFAEVNLEIITPDTADEKVDISKISGISFHSSINKFSDLDMDADSPDFRTISYAAAGATMTLSDGTITTADNGYDRFEAAPIYIEPVNVTAPDTLLEVTFTDGSLTNVYPMEIAANANFEAGKSYTVTITLLKTEVAEVGIKMVDWGNGGGITGGAKIVQ